MEKWKNTQISTALKLDTPSNGCHDLIDLPKSKTRSATMKESYRAEKSSHTGLKANSCGARGRQFARSIRETRS